MENKLNGNKPEPGTAGQEQKELIKILLVDDEEDARATLSELLELNQFTVTAINSAENALKILQNSSFDMVISDLFMPGMDGIDLTKSVNQMRLDVPVIVMTGFATIESAVESMKAGASDFVTKPFNIDQIKIVINRTLETKRLQKLATEREYYENLSNIDELTALNNYRYFQHILQVEVDREKRYKRPLSLMMIDIDDFKVCNDTYGHLAGDMVLREIAGLIKKTTRGCDFAVRYGGEEFAVILPETPKQEALVVAQRIRTSIEEYAFEIGNGKGSLRLTVTLGLSSIPEDAQDGRELIEKADQELYRGKVQGKNCICISGQDRTWSGDIK
ncbi:MAG: diguanylate cyclase [Proteobacteria bacterium]|nr:diguanylate cyclase [Pseudomonadota bacterium]